MKRPFKLNIPRPTLTNPSYQNGFHPQKGKTHGFNLFGGFLKVEKNWLLLIYLNLKIGKKF